MVELEVTDDSVDIVLELDEEANGPRLRVEDRSTGDVSYLDPLQIECLTRVPEGQFEKIVSDSRVET